LPEAAEVQTPSNSQPKAMTTATCIWCHSIANRIPDCWVNYLQRFNKYRVPIYNKNFRVPLLTRIQLLRGFAFGKILYFWVSIGPEK